MEQGQCQHPVDKEPRVARVVQSLREMTGPLRAAFQPLMLRRRYQEVTGR